MFQPPIPSSDAVVAEAHSWLKTPWHHEARVKGVGVDCAQLLNAVYSACGLTPEVITESYPADWHLHNDRPRFVETVEQYADRLPDGETPAPGDIVLFHFGRQDAHGGIVVEVDPLVIIHAYYAERMVVKSLIPGSPLESRVAGFYRLKVA